VRAVDGLARRLDNQQGVEDTQRVGNFEMYDFPADAVAPSMNALRARDLMAYQTRADEKNGNFTISEAEVANSLSALWPGDTSHRSMTLVQAVIQDSREMANKTQNGLGVSTEDISYTLTSIDRPAVFRKSSRAQTNEDSETWVEGDVANTLNSFDVGDVRTTHAIVSAAAFKAGNSAAARSIGYEEEISPSLEAGGGGNNKPTVLLGMSYDGFNQKVEPDGAHRTLRIGRDSSDFVIAPGGVDDDSLLPIGLDSHRYRCCGNGVVAPVAEWIGRRIVEVDRRWREEGK
jgi:site-specific DNA-cytosine methylase